MSIFDRMFGTPNSTKDDDLADVREAFSESLGALQRKLNEDPCAADPTRDGCDEARRALIRQRPDLASAVLSGRDTWRARR